MRDVYLGIVNKRHNSTSQPSLSSFDRYEVTFKEGFSYETPTIVLAHGGLLPWYNYMYIPDIATYFWVDEKKAIQNGRYELHAHVDVLATYKSAIMNTSAYIEYGFNANTGAAATRVPDHRIALSKRPTISVSEFDFLNDLVDTANGCFILSAVGKSDGVRTYAMSSDQIHGLVNSLNNDIGTAMESLETTEEILKYLSINSLSQGSAMGAIKSCIWLPFRINKVGAVLTEVYLGDYDTHVKGYRISSNLYKTISSGTISWDAADWKRLNTQILIYAPFMGTVALPIDQCNNASNIWVSYSFDLYTGSAACMLKADDYIFYTGTANIASSYAIGSSNVPVQNLVNGSLTAVGGAITAGAGVAQAFNPLTTTQGIQNAVSGVQQGVQGVMEAITPVVQSAGTMSGAAAVGIDQKSKIIKIYYPAIGESAIQSVYGYPVSQVARPVAGYCKTRGFSVNGARGTADEISQINAYMDGGVFIE